MSAPTKRRAPVAPTTEAPGSNMGRDVAEQAYSAIGDGRKADLIIPDARHVSRARARPIDAYRRRERLSYAKVSYCDSAGRKWAYGGKKGRVLAMLVTGRDGVTQWDTLPWHTRLSGTIHAMRSDGLAIGTQREGDCGHARYRLQTPGTLFQQSETGAEAVIIHRVKP